MKTRTRHTIVLLLFLFPLLNGRNAKDSLLAVVSTAPRDTNYVMTLFVLAGEYATSNADSTVWYAREIRRISDSLHYQNGIGRSHFMIGLSFYVRGMEDSAMTWFQRTLDVFNATRDPDGLALAYHNIGRLYTRRGELSKAKQYVGIALDLRRRHSSLGAVLSSVSMLGLIAGEEKDLRQEETYYREALTIAQRITPYSSAGIGMALTNLAWVEYKQKDYAKAKEHFRKALKEYRLMRDVNGAGEVLLGLSRIAMEQKEYRNAIRWAKQVVQDSYRTRNPEGILKGAEILSEVYERTGDYKNALIYHKLNAAQQDSINRMFARKEYVNALSRFETEQKESRIIILEQENRLKSMQRNILAGVVLLVIAGAAAYFLRFRELRKIDAAQRAEEMQREYSSQLLAQQEQERKRIAAELHDSLGQNLLIIKNMIDLGVRTKQPLRSLKSQLSELSEISARSIEEVRTIAGALHPYQLNRMGLTKALTAMMRDLERSARLRLTYSIDTIEGRYSKETEAHIYRIVQEAVSNILKHAQASAVEVIVRQTDTLLSITITDDGKGFAVQTAHSKETLVGGLGLFGMKERARIIGGNVRIHSEPGKGTSIVVLLPA